MSVVKVYLNPSHRSIDVYIYRKIDGQNSQVGRLDANGELAYTECKPNSIAPINPTFRIPDHLGPALAVAIQEVGLPCGKTWERGQLDAMAGHLQDMRALVFKGKVEPIGK